MASEETTQTENGAEETPNAVTENNMAQQAPAQMDAEAAGVTNGENVNATEATQNIETGSETGENVTETTAENQSEQNSETPSETSATEDAFTTEATAPEIAALGEVHSEQTATEATAAAETATAPEQSAETSSQTATPTETEPEQHAKKENVVVRKLKPNPNAKAAVASAAPSSESGSTTGAQSQTHTASSGAAKPAPKRAAESSSQPDEQIEGMDFGAILQQFEQEQQEAQAKYREGTVVEGTVVGISERGVLIDFGYKSEGVVNQEEFKQDGEMAVNLGDTTEVVVKRLDTPEGLAELSRAEAVKIRTWDMLEKASQTGEPVKGRVTDKVKGGLQVDINGIEAFLPGSLIDPRPPRNLDVYKGQEIEARVIKFSRKRGNIVLSRKALIDEVVNAQKAETMQNISEGYIVEGKIKSMTDYGAFVDLGGIDGLLHVTDMSWGKLDKPSDMFKVGDEVQVKVLKIDRDKERISLGYKQLIPNPWSSVEERYTIGSKHIGKVTSTTDYGAFVELEPGVEGLVHVSEMTWSKRAKHPNKIVRPGQEIEVQVLRIDQKDRRVSLGMRQVMTNPWETIYDRYPIGTRVKGRVRNMTDFGAFVELEEGVDGLVHLSDITHSKKIKHPSEVLKKNQEVEAIVTGINVEGRRMSLSMKDLQPSSWDRFVSEHKPGDIVRGRISRFANFGVFVELAEELEGLCHISELSDERIEKPEKVFEIGQEMDFKILRIEPDAQKIGLSHRAVGKADEPVVDTKTYSTEAKSGMASLAELANLRNLRGGGEENQ